MQTDHHLARMSRPVQVPASNSDARKRGQVQQPHHDPAVVELMARAWDEGYQCGVLDELYDPDPAVNPYEEAAS